mgnify:CR=1 FL=1
METYNLNTLSNQLHSGVSVSNEVLSTLLRKVYAWMSLSLLLTGFTAYAVFKNSAILNFLQTNPSALFVLMIAQLGLAILFTARLFKMSLNVGGALFAFYSLLTGVMFSSIFLLYTQESIASTFFITAGTFGAMSLYGYFTKKDLSSMGKYLIMGLIGIIIASLVNLFLHSSTVMWITTYVGVAIFVGLTAYDTQKIKEMLQIQSQEGLTENSMKVALYGSFMLYLDFINLFLKLLRIFGRRK